MTTPTWLSLAQKLPASKSPKDAAARRKLFKLFDPNGNGYLSLAELDKGLIVQFQLDGGSDFATKRCKPAILRAFTAAKGVDGDAGTGGDYVTISEFRLLLVYLQRYFELLAVFDAVDVGDDRRVDQNEFAQALPKLKEWGVVVKNPAAEFKQIDTNGGGQVLFDEFAGWALKKGLDMLRDGIDESEASLQDNHLSSEEAAAKGAAALAAKRAAGGGGEADDGPFVVPKWIELAHELPAGQTAEDAAERKKLFALFDPNGNGYLSLAELDKGLIVQFQLDGGDEFATKRCKPAILRAFQAAKGVSGGDGTGADYVTKSEFRLLLVYLQRYFELLAVFDEVDTGDDRRVDVEEFKRALPKLKEWGVEVSDPEAEFKQIDTNGGGQVLFDEFAGWALAKGLDLEGGEDDDSLINNHTTADEEMQRAMAEKQKYEKNKSQYAGVSGEFSTPKWVELANKLPASKSAEDTAEREKLLVTMDPNGNGYLSLAEVDKGIIEKFIELGGDEFTTKRCKPAINRAFHAAKGIGGDDGRGGDYVTKSEFRLFLVYVQRYFELLAVFDEVDTSDDRRVELQEFINALPKLKEWGIEVTDPQAEFDKMDGNDGGIVLFDEFAGWALKRGLDLEGGVEDDSLIQHHRTSDEEMARVRKQKAAQQQNQVQPAGASGEFTSPQWVELAHKLPASKSAEHSAERDALFRAFDPNGNGYLSLAECDKGIIEQFIAYGGDEHSTKRCKPAINRAFHAAKGVGGDDGRGGDYVTKSEFRLFLVYVQRYFELLAVFDEVDTSDDRRVEVTEFINALPKLKEWGIVVTDPQAEFDKMDGNDGGIVLFDEFAGWALKRGLDLEGGVEDDSLSSHHRTSEEEMARVRKQKRKEKAGKKKAALADKKAAFVAPSFIDLANKLPASKTKEDATARKILFRTFDPNGNGYLSLAEADRGLIVKFQLVGGDEFATKRCKPAINRAFHAAKGINGDDGTGGDYITKQEFRLFLVYVQRYFELLAVFDEVDTSDDRRVELKEFIQALPKLREWGIEVADPQKAFNEIDLNGGGIVLFDEFAGWALKKGLDLEGGEDDDTLLSHHRTSDEELASVRKKKAQEKKSPRGKKGPQAPDEPPNWVALAKKLPAGKTPAEAAARRILFNTFDPNGNGLLSLAEVDKGLIVQFQRVGGDQFATKQCKPAINRAFHAAKGIDGTEGRGGDYVTKSEFRLLLVYLQRYFELLAIFDVVDSGDDRRVDLNEFKAALPLLNQWGVEVSDPEAEFKQIDSNGGGQALFDEFAGWALQEGLDMDEDDDDEEDSLLQHHTTTGQGVAKAMAEKKAQVAAKDKAAAGPKKPVVGEVPGWVELAKRLPTKDTEEDAAKRKKLFALFDPNGNGKLSLAEVDKGLMVQFQLDGGDEFSTKRCKPAINRAFHAAKGVGKGDADYVTQSEYRTLLLTVQRYFELLAVFDVVDTGDDRRVDEGEFGAAIALLSNWGVVVADPSKEFKKIDKNGGGQVLFDEFVEWALKKGLEFDEAEKKKKPVPPPPKAGGGKSPRRPRIVEPEEPEPPPPPPYVPPIRIPVKPRSVRLMFEDIQIEPVDFASPKAKEDPFQAYLEAQKRFTTAVSLSRAASQVPSAAPSPRGAQAGFSKSAPNTAR